MGSPAREQEAVETRSSWADISPRWFDHIVTCGLGLLIIGTPLAMGSVHLWAYATMEILIFGLAIVWMARVWAEGAAPARMSIAPRALKRLLLPVGVLIAVVAFQLLPLPPRLIRILAPGTYRVYQSGVPGWPAESPYRALIAAWQASINAPPQPQIQVVLPPVGGSRKQRAQAASPEAVAKHMAPKTPDRTRPEAPGLFGRMRWRPLALAPLAGWSALIEIIACATLFFLVLLYPFGLPGEGMDAQRRFFRTLIMVLLGSGALVAMLGIVEHGWWNGKILWVFVPKDWPGPLANDPRASGPFVNADHFANYLVMLLPLAVAGAIFPILPGSRHRRSSDVQLISALAAFLMASGILMSLSRAGWMLAIFGIAMAAALCVRHASDQLPAMLRGFGLKMLPVGIGAAAAALLVLLYLVGPSARTQASGRIGGTIEQGEDLTFKPIMWRATLGMIHDFPLFGVGIGSWPEIYPHYQPPPWQNFFFFREPENDYLQLAAETGLAGLAVSVWLAWAVFVPIRAGARVLRSRDWPLFAGLAAGLTAALIHELVDFSLQTPANLLLFTVLLALLLRIALTKGVARPEHALRSVSSPNNRTFVRAVAMGLVAAGLIVCTVTQREVAYPFDLKQPKTFASAEAAVAIHPARSSTHIALAALMPSAAPKPLVIQQLKDAVWLDPNDPFGRDLYARSLFLTGDKAEALRQIALSAQYAPSLDEHFYLAHPMIPWLLPEEQHAVASGLTAAVKANYYGAPDQLADFYATLGRQRDAAQVLAAAAARSRDPHEKADYLIGAAHHYAAAHNLKQTRATLLEAAESDPADPQPLADLIVLVLGPERDITTARALVQAGIERGGDPEELELALADAARKAGDAVTMEDALRQVMDREPSFEEAMAAGRIYSDQGSYDRAAVAFERAAEMDQQSAGAVFALAIAEEQAYQYALAARDYAHALALDPRNDDIRRGYLQFQRRVAESGAQPNSSNQDKLSGQANSSILPAVPMNSARLAPGG